jgi:hypothetical protein
MKLSENTINVLRNFASINNGLWFNSGKVLATVSESKTVLARATLKDEIPKDFGIYELNGFLSVLSLSKDNELDFDDANVIIKAQNGRSKIQYRVTEKKMIHVPPSDSITLPSIDIEFTLSEDDYNTVMQYSKVLISPNIAIVGDGQDLKISCFDISNNAAHVSSLDVAPTDKTFKFVFKTENFKMVPGSYDVSISKQGIAHFKNKNDTIEYWVVAEKEGTKYGE